MKLSLTLSVFVLLASLLLTGCSSDKYVGKWETYEMVAQGASIPVPEGNQVVFEIKKAGKAYQFIDAKNTEIAKPVRENGKLVFREKSEGGQELVTTLAVDRTLKLLTIDVSSAGKTLTLKCRKKS